MKLMFLTLTLWAAFATPASAENPLPRFAPAETAVQDAGSGQPAIVFLTSTDFPPFNFVDSSGRLTGFNVYLAKAICERLQAQASCTIQAQPWADLPDALRRGQGNAVIGGLSPEALSGEDFTFSLPYLRFPGRLVATKALLVDGNPPVMKAGVRLGVVDGSAHAGMARSFFTAVSISGFASDVLLLDALKRGKVDMAFGDGMRLAFLIGGGASAGCCQFTGGPYYSEEFLGQGMRIAFARSNMPLRKRINEALAGLQSSGELDELYLRFFPHGFY